MPITTIEIIHFAVQINFNILFKQTEKLYFWTYTQQSKTFDYFFYFFLRFFLLSSACTLVYYTYIVKRKSCRRPFGMTIERSACDKAAQITSYDSQKGVAIRLVVRVRCNCRGHFSEEGRWVCVCTEYIRVYVYICLN